MSGFQVHFSSKDIFTPGDTVDALVAMNPAALATNLSDLRTGGILIVNSDAFESKGLDQAGYDANPLEDGSLKSYRLHPVAMTKLTRAAVEGLALSQKEKDRCRNFFAMGLVFWLYDRPLEPTLRYIDDKFGKKPEIAAGQCGGTQGRIPLRRNRGGDQHAVSCAQSKTAARQIHEHCRQHFAGLWADDGRPVERQAAVPGRATRSRPPAAFWKNWPGTRTSTCSLSRPRMKSRP